MDSAYWAQLGANVLGMGSTMALMLGMAWGSIKRSQQQIAEKAINKLGVVTQSTYDNDRLQLIKIIDQLAGRVDKVELYDKKLGILEERISNVQSDVTEMKSDVKALDKTITNAIVRAVNQKP